MEYCPGGDMYNLSNQINRMSESQTRFYAAELLMALKHIHAHGIVYRDLKVPPITI